MRVVLLVGLLMLGLSGCESDGDDVADGSVDPGAGQGGHSGHGGSGAGGSGAGGSGAGGSGAGGSGAGGSGAGGEDCDVTPPTACPSDMPTYADVAPIFEERCVTCHAGPGQSEECPICWALTDYGHVVSWEAEIRSALVGCVMPPEGSGMSISDDERTKILEWLRCGAPE